MAAMINPLTVDGVLAFHVFDLMAVAVFAITGALVASRKQMDVFGFVMLGTATGIGGGTVRDVLLGLPVFWVQDGAYVVACVTAASVTFFAAHLLHSRYRAILWLDAVGLSVYCVLGAEKALAHGVSPLVAIVMGVITGTFGGIIRDVLGGEVPLLLRRDVYVTAALAGALAFVAAVGGGAPHVIAWFVGIGACFAVRGLALWFGWSLPTYKARPGRTPEQLAELGLWQGKADPNPRHSDHDDGMPRG